MRHKHEFLDRHRKKANIRYRHQYNYQRLIFDTQEACRLLKALDLATTNRCLEVFRDGLNEGTNSAEELHAILADPEAAKTQNMLQEYDQNVAALSEDVYYAMQICLEFLDKGMKGLLVGDLSSYALTTIQRIIGRNEAKLKDIQEELEQALQEMNSIEGAEVGVSTAAEFYESRFSIDDAKFKPNSISFDTVSQEEAMDAVDTPGSLKGMGSVSDVVNYGTAQKQWQFDPTKIQDLGTYLETVRPQAKDQVQFDTTKQKIERLEARMNGVINAIYDQIAHRLFKLDKFILPIHGIPNPDAENPLNLFKRQLKLEELSFDLAHRKYKQSLNDLIKIGRADQLAASHRYILRWMKAIEGAVTEQQRIYVKRANIDPLKNQLGFHLIQLPAEKISAICVMHLIKQLFTRFAVDARQAEDELLAAKVVEGKFGNFEASLEIPSIEMFLDLGALFDKELRNAKAARQGKAEKLPGEEKKDERDIQRHLIVDDYRIGSMKKEMQVKLGAFLTNLMCKGLKYHIGKQEHLLLKPKIVKKQKRGTNKENQPRTLGVIAIEKAFIEKFIQELDKIHDLNLQIENSLPMIYKPAPWKNYYFGGYYLKQTKMVKIMPQGAEGVKYMQRSDLSQVCDVLNSLGDVAWRVNQRVFDVMEHIWTTGGGAGEIPPRFNKRMITPEMIRDAPFKEKLKLLKEHQQNNEQHALRCEFLLRLSMAQSFKSCQKLYFPHNMDFRGRVYPIPPHLNHMGSDINRGILEFSEARPLGERGLYWLKVHLANNMGMDKLPIAERAAYADDIVDVIHRVAEDPTGNSADWLDAENPWQALATMFEISDALKSGDPENHRCRLHVHVDGSCNGMQHYAAFGRDSSGGRQVNLADSERPGDVYTAILQLVLRDIEKERSPDYVDVAESLKGHVTRKVIKQTVMTSVYGVTFIGARAQIQRQLKDRKAFATNGELYRASQYVARLTIKCIGDLFRDANGIKEWFAKCARIVAGTGDPVRWLTPLGLPCEQPYKSTSSIDIISTIIQQINVAGDWEDQPVNKQKQSSAFPPNYVHSIDSTHMMLTAIQCRNEGITFAGVHDSFWTHPSDVDRMGAILRDQFVRLHSAPLIDSLHAGFSARYPLCQFPSIPPAGDFDLEEVKKSTYFFS